MHGACEGMHVSVGACVGACVCVCVRNARSWNTCSSTSYSWHNILQWHNILLMAQPLTHGTTSYSWHNILLKAQHLTHGATSYSWHNILLMAQHLTQPTKHDAETRLLTYYWLLTGMQSVHTHTHTHKPLCAKCEHTYNETKCSTAQSCPTPCVRAYKWCVCVCVCVPC